MDKNPSKSRLAWLRRRKSAIGSSDIAAILGLSRFGTPLSVWSDKVSTTAKDSPPSEAMEAGILLEPVVAEWFRRETGLALTNPGRHKTFRDAECPILMATPDRLIEGPSEALAVAHGLVGPGVLEIKTANAMLLGDWEDSPPSAYQIQVQHQLACTGFQWAAIAVLVGGNKFRWHLVKRDEAVIMTIRLAAAQFWRRYVELGIQPPVGDGPVPINPEANIRILKVLYPNGAPGKTVYLSVEAERRLAEMERAQEDAKAATDRATHAKAILIQMMGDAEAAELPSGATLTYSTVRQPAQSRVVSEYSYRVLRVKRPKKT